MVLDRERGKGVQSNEIGSRNKRSQGTKTRAKMALAEHQQVRNWIPVPVALPTISPAGLVRFSAVDLVDGLRWLGRLNLNLSFQSPFSFCYCPEFEDHQ